MADADPTPTLPRSAPAEAPPATSRRRRLFGILAAVLGVAALAYFAWDFFIGSRRVSTDNAYVGAESATLAAETSGTVRAIKVMETQQVKAGDLLVVLDPADARIALDQAEANLASAERRVAGYYANDRALAAQVTARGAEIAAAEARVEAARADLAKAKIDLDRRQALAASGAVSGDELTSVRNRFAAATAALAGARADAAQARAGVGQAEGSQAINAALIRGRAGENPEVRAARAAVARARLDLARTEIRAPVSGIVSRKTVQIGQRVAAGTTLLTVVPVESAFVDANFKESQLGGVRIGQKATLTSDLYGGDVVYHGTVTGLSGGTGAAFALIPAQNASGNWIKVVQRLPVRITLDPKELRAHPLRIGLSMSAEIDIADAN
ncbi:hemolysin D [alpha proteobacterium AAP81b]|nr:hemolysin D [alpha proteobacterium AAP81b]